MTRKAKTWFHRAAAFPNRNTFEVLPIRMFVRRYLSISKISCDPFARNCRHSWATHTNDIDPSTRAEYHLDAEEFLRVLAQKNIRCDLAIMDPPYSPRQISECYKKAGVKCGMEETQNGRLLKRVRKALLPVLTDNAIVLSFGWNSVGMGQGWELLELLLVCHGGAHNDTICMAQRRI